MKCFGPRGALTHHPESAFGWDRHLPRPQGYNEANLDFKGYWRETEPHTEETEGAYPKPTVSNEQDSQAWGGQAGTSAHGSCGRGGV